MNHFVRLLIISIWLANFRLATMAEPVEPESWFQHWSLDPPAGCPVGPLTPFELYIHYCEQESRYPLIYDRQCYPLSMDRWENQTAIPDDPYLWAFIDHFRRHIRHRPDVAERMRADIQVAAAYGHEHGQDCQHESVWLDQFSDMSPPVHSVYSWTQNCVLQLPYVAVISRHTELVYDPNLYEARIRDPDTAPATRQWMERWMEKFHRLLRPTDQYRVMANGDHYNAHRFAEHQHIGCDQHRGRDWQLD